MILGSNISRTKEEKNTKKKLRNLTISELFMVEISGIEPLTS